MNRTYMKARSTLLTLLALGSATACRDESPLATGAVPSISGRASLVATGSRASSIDEAWDRISGTADEFAGIFRDDQGRLVVLVTTPGAVGRVRQALAAEAPELGKEVGQAEVRVVSRGYRYLREVVRKGRVHGIAGVHAVDIDEVQNRVHLVVDNDAQRVAALAQLERAGVDREALIITVAPRAVPTATLSDYSRPVRGGLRHFTMNGAGNAIGAGTTGVIVRRSGDGARYLVTASHTTPTWFFNDYSGMWQNDYLWFAPDSMRIADEWEDPMPVLNGPGCPSWQSCRQADAALFKLREGIASAFTIPRTDFLSVTPGVLGGTTITGAPFTVTGAVTWSRVVSGAGSLHKVGITTGWTAGPITATCVDRLIGSSGIWALCSYEMSTTVAGGDSGSPVFQFYGGASGNDVDVAGITWGAATVAGTLPSGYSYYSTLIFSPWFQVLLDLPGLIPNP